MSRHFGEEPFGDAVDGSEILTSVYLDSFILLFTRDFIDAMWVAGFPNLQLTNMSAAMHQDRRDTVKARFRC